MLFSLCTSALRIATFGSQQEGRMAGGPTQSLWRTGGTILIPIPKRNLI